MVSHNNDGIFYEIAIDSAKEGSEVWDLNPYFKARVGDSNAALGVRWYNQGLLAAFDGKQKPIISGNVGSYSIDAKTKELIMAPDAAVVNYTGTPNDMLPGGRAKYVFPEQMFPKEGAFKGFIGYVDESDGKRRVSGVTVWFKVLPGVAQMGKACDFYVDILDKTIANFKEKIRQQSIDFDAALQQELQKEKDLIQQKLDAAGDAIDEDTATLKKLAVAVGAIQAQIDADNVITKQEFDNVSAQNRDYIDQKFKELMETVGDATPHFIDKASSLATTYPNGAKGLYVALDDKNRYLWYNNAWTNFGTYQGEGIKDKYITNRMIADSTIQDNVISTVHLSSIQDSYAFVGEATAWNGRKTDQSIYIDKDNVAWVKKSTEQGDAGILFPVRLPFVPTDSEAAYVDFAYSTVNADGLKDKVDIWITQNDGTLIKQLWTGPKKAGSSKIKISAADFAQNNYPKDFSLLFAVHGGTGTLDVCVRVSFNADNIELPIRNYQLGKLISTNHPGTGVWDDESWIDASKIHSSNENLLSKAVLWNAGEYDAINFNNGELVKTSGDLSYNSGITVPIEADTTVTQYMKIVYGYHGLGEGHNGPSVFLGDAKLSLKKIWVVFQRRIQQLLLLAELLRKYLINMTLKTNLRLSLVAKLM